MSKLSPQQVNMLYGLGTLVTLLALGAMATVEARRTERVTARAPALTQRIKVLDDQLSRTDRVKAAIRAETAAIGRLRALLGNPVAEAKLISQVATWRQELAIPPVHYTRERADQPAGLWPAERELERHPAYPCRALYLAFEGSYWQICALIERLERMPELVIVEEVVVRRPAPDAEGRQAADLGKVPLLAGVKLILPRYDAEGDLIRGSATPSIDAAGRAKAFGLPRQASAPEGDDGWAKRGVDWRQPKGQLPARNPFDPFAALTPGELIGQSGAQALAALKKALEGDSITAANAIAERAREHAADEPALAGELARLAAWRELEAALKQLPAASEAAAAGSGASLTRLRGTLASLAPRLEHAGRQRRCAAAIAEADKALAAAEPPKLDEQAAARIASQIQRSRDALAKGDAPAARAALTSARQVLSTQPAEAGAAARGKLAQLEAQIKRHEAVLAAPLTLTSIVTLQGKRSARINGKFCKVGDTIEAGGMTFEVLEISSSPAAVEVRANGVKRTLRRK